MQKLYSLKRSRGRLMTGVIWLLMAVLFAQPLAAQPDSLRPDITSFTPRSARTGQNVFIFGKHFTGATSVSFGNVPAQSYVVFADTGIRAVVGNGASGAIRVATPFGVDTANGFTFIRDTLPIDTTRPDIISFTPTSGRLGTNVLIFGKHLNRTTAVSFGGVPALRFAVGSDTSIIAEVGLGATGAVRVANPFGADSLNGFTFIRDTLPPDSLRPDITSFTPRSARTGTPVFIFGKHFTGTTSVSFGNVPASSFIVFADSGIRAVVGNGASGAIRVATPFGVDTANGFTYIRDTLPPDSSRLDITSFTPRSGKTGTNVFIFGKGLTRATAVQFGRVPAASFTILSDSLIRATVGNGASGFVTVFEPRGRDSLCCFTYIRDTIPSDTLADIVGFTPTSGSKGTNVFIFGKNLSRTFSVVFGNVRASFTVLSDSLIRATVGNGASGFVKVFTWSGADSLCCFTYIKDTIPSDSTSPDIAWFSPTSGTTGTQVFIYGAHFTGATAVSFGGVPAASFSVLSDSAIMAVVDTGATGKIKVTTPFGVDTLGTFTYKSPIVVHYSVTVSPNPANGYAIITHPAISGFAQLKLADIAGNVIQTVKVSPNVSQTRLNLGGVKPGVYKLGWSNGTKWYSQTLLVR